MIDCLDRDRMDRVLRVMRAAEVTRASILTIFPLLGLDATRNFAWVDYWPPVLVLHGLWFESPFIFIRIIYEVLALAVFNSHDGGHAICILLVGAKFFYDLQLWSFLMLLVLDELINNLTLQFQCAILSKHNLVALKLTRFPHKFIIFAPSRLKHLFASRLWWVCVSLQHL